MILFLTFITCSTFPVLCCGICDYKYVTEPSVFDRPCSLMGASVKFQCSVGIDINTVRTINSGCDDYHIIWYFSTDFVLKFNIENEFSSNYSIIDSSSCTRNRSQTFWSKSSSLTINAVQPHHLGYYWCKTKIVNNEDKKNPQIPSLYSGVGLIRDVSICQQVQPVAQCDEPVTEQFQPVDGDTCASTEPPIQPLSDLITPNCPLNMISDTITPDLTGPSSTDHSSVYPTPETLPTSTVDSISADSTASTENSLAVANAMVYIFAVALLLIFTVIIAALLVVIAICYKKHASSTVSATSGLPDKAESDLNTSCMNNACDSFSAVRCPLEVDDALEYEVMHGAPPVKDTSNKNGTYPFNMENSSTEKDGPENHIYAHIGQSLKELKTDA